MIEFIYVFTCAALLPFFKWRAEAQPQSAPFILLSILYIAWRIIGGDPLPVDGVTAATLAFGLWIVGSLVWTDTHQSKFEVFVWLSCLTLFTAARTLPLEVVAWCVFTPGVIMAALQLWRKYHCWKNDIPVGTFDMVVFGNTNHHGSFLMMSLFAGLIINDLAIMPFIMLIGVGIALARCRGAVLATVTALIVVVGLTVNSYIALLLISALMAAFMYLKDRDEGGLERNSTSDRPLLYAIAFKMFKAKPITGWGLNMFRKIMPEMTPGMASSRFKVVSSRAKSGLIDNADRVHNDHLELLAEIGIIGYLLFLYLVLQVVFTPFVAGFMVAVAINALVFFPLREPHTAMPFWALVGAATVTTPLSWGVLKIAAIGLLAAVLVQVLLKVCAYVYFAQMEQATEEKDKRQALKYALKCDPLNGHFLSDAAYYFRDSMEGLEYSLRGIMAYDGNRVLWGAYDQLARLLLCNDIPRIAEWATDKSLSYNPEFAPAHEIKSLIHNIRLMGAPEYQPIEK